MGKGDSPRNCFSKEFKDNYESINWNRKKVDKPKKKTKYQSDDITEPECEHCGKIYCDCPSKY